ncbi:CU044_5270 family protein [Streptomyces sp. NPDC001868]|uniref:CU044_5270 family protein n=1 Tax=Streptomyces sp. NPDC001868 TaxID=3154401 RepID=UPI0033203090
MNDNPSPRDEPPTKGTTPTGGVPPTAAAASAGAVPSTQGSASAEAAPSSPAAPSSETAASSEAGRSAGEGVPAAVERELPAGRRRVLREHLMREIEREAEVPLVRRPVWRRPALVVPAVAAVLTAAIVLGASVTRQAAQPPTTHADSTDGGGKSDTDATRSDRSAAALLERIAKGAGKRTLPPVRNDQFVYTERDDYHWKVDPGKPATGCPMTSEGHPFGIREVWWSVDGQHVGLSREHKDGGKVVERSVAKQLPAKNGVAYFREAESELPTDADAMYRYLYGLKDDAARPSGAKAADRNAFEKASALLSEQLLPPKVEAALYLALARIPGLVVYEGAVDGAGRKGVSVSLEGSWPGDYGQGPTRHELLFDTRTLYFLARNSVNVDPPANACQVLEPGDLVSSVAILDRGVVDRTGERP